LANRSALSRATILPHEGYELPILAIVDEHGGRAPTREVLDELGKRLERDLMPADYEKLASGDIRWRNRAQFVRIAPDRARRHGEGLSARAVGDH